VDILSCVCAILEREREREREREIDCFGDGGLGGFEKLGATCARKSGEGGDGEGKWPSSGRPDDGDEFGASHKSHGHLLAH
jgi:hypothetical protein